jgi:membrane protein DedA with SNARE-associated domain
MKIVPFALYTFIGSAVWNIVLIGAGAILGDNWDAVGEYVGIFQYVVIAVVGLALIRFAFTVIKRRRCNRAIF